MLPIRNISYLLPMCCSFLEKCKNSPKTGLGCSTPLIAFIESNHTILLVSGIIVQSRPQTVNVQFCSNCYALTDNIGAIKRIKLTLFAVKPWNLAWSLLKNTFYMASIDLESLLVNIITCFHFSENGVKSLSCLKDFRNR